MDNYAFFDTYHKIISFKPISNAEQSTTRQ